MCVKILSHSAKNVKAGIKKLTPSSPVVSCSPCVPGLICAPDRSREDSCFVDPLLEECVRNEVGDAHVCRQTSPRETPPFPPLVKALELSGKQNAASFHFPGHNRGRAAPSSLTQLIGTLPFHHDLPELPELDNLFSPQGPILEAQLLAAELFGASQTWFLVGGTTCGIQAAVMATCCPGDSLILPRNCHVSAISGMVLSGAVPKYMIPEFNRDWGIAGGITHFQVEHAIKELQLEGRKAAAVFVTSPTYHGVCKTTTRAVARTKYDGHYAASTKSKDTSDSSIPSRHDTSCAPWKEEFK
uniref:Orn/Lys/Arg decarboxylases family 1 pyridoxal-P attachment site domain-containing protein n=1 Tax=Kalanchoe fedtschenkoi TaxID=63787 RepID=A0A7N0USG4_KALFE